MIGDIFMGNEYAKEQEEPKKKQSSQKAAEETVKVPKEKRDRGWNLWSKAMNKVSGGKLYKEEKAAHKKRKAQRQAQAQHESDVSKTLSDVDADSVVKTPTGSKEEQLGIRNQLAQYANDQMDQTDKVNAFVQKEYGLENSAEFGSVAGRMMQGLYRDTGDKEADYEYNRTVGDYVPDLMKRAEQAGYSKQENVAEALGENEIYMISSIIIPVIDDLRKIRDNGGYMNCAMNDFSKAKMALGKINSIQDILKNYCGQNPEMRDAIYQLCGTDKEEFTDLTMGMSMALRDAGRSMGDAFGMDNISSYQRDVATQEREKREGKNQKPKRKREAEYAALKANQRSFIQEKGVMNTSDHRMAYMALSMKDKARANNIQREAMGDWIKNSGSYSEVLRNDKSFDEMRKEAKNPKETDNLNFMEKMVGVIDSVFTDNAGLEESMETYRGVGDGFLSFLFAQRGLSPKDYLNKDGSLNYQKIDKKGLLKSLIGMTYQDKCFVSTSTNRGYAAMWANQNEFNDANKIRNEVLENSKTEEGSLERKELERYSEAAVLNKAESGKGGHMMVMNLPAGTKAIFADAFGSTSKDSKNMVGSPQNEITLDRGLMYKITDVSGSAGSYQLHVTVAVAGSKKAAEPYNPKTDDKARPALDTGIQDV